MRITLSTLFALLLMLAVAVPAHALELTDRNIAVDESVSVKAVGKIADKLLKLDAAQEAPIYLLISATKGSAQGVMLLADTIRSVKSPVVGVVLTQVHGAGAALAPFTDRMLIYPSAGLVLTEIEYEGVKKPKPPKTPEPAKEGAKPTTPKPPEPPTKESVLLQRARAEYLARVYGRLAKRMNMKASDLTKKIAAGGFIVTADEAVDRKIAFAKVNSLSYVKLPVEKTEVKVIRTKKSVRTLGEAPTPGDG